MEVERDALKLSNTTLGEEKRDLEGKLAEMEMQRSAAVKQEEESKVRIAELEAQNNSLEVLLKAASE